MTESPRLTIGIPHLDRTEHLQWAIDSCLKQTKPVHILIADQGKTDKTWNLLRRYEGHPHIEHLPTEATCLWENWDAAARACDTEFFAWLQDDDTIARVYADRVVKAFDAFPLALHWEASCYVTPDRIHSLRWGWNGPQVGVNMQDLIPEMWPGEFLVASSYILSWSLSPGVAFRCGEQFNRALDAMPTDCDLFLERTILAAMGSQGPFIADPVTAGYWHHHGSNESYKQNADGSLLAQSSAMTKCLDLITDQTEQWSEAFEAWLRSRNPTEILTWLSQCSEEGSTHPIAQSRHSEQLQATMRQSLIGRVEATPANPEHVQKAGDRVLIFD